MNLRIAISAALLFVACASTPKPDLRSRHTLADIRTFASAIESYAAARREFPRAATIETLRGLLEPEFMRVGSMLDGWGQPLRYSSTDGCHYKIESDGPDRVSGTPDDVLYADNGFLKVPAGAEALLSVHEDRHFACRE